jgi:PadR family transcriptional regulator PadR
MGGKTNPAFMSGVPELLVLRLLSRQEMYGYELVRAIRVVSEEAFCLAEGVVYPMLHSLEKKGLLKARALTVDGRNRVYYSVTPKGRKRLAVMFSEWQRIRSGLDTVLENKNG